MRREFLATLMTGGLALMLISASAVGGQEREREVDVQAGPVQVQVESERDRPAAERARRDAETRQREGIRGERVEQPAGRQPATRDRQQVTGETAGQATGRMVQRAGDITGATVRNPAGTDLGTINELVIDMQTGQIRYAALAFGGFLGFGEKLFAVPWEAFDIRFDEDGDKFFVLDVSEEALKNAPGFDSDSWPDFADPRWSQEVDQFYEKHRRDDRSDQAQPRRPATGVQPGGQAQPRREAPREGQRQPPQR